MTPRMNRSRQVLLAAILLLMPPVTRSRRPLDRATPPACVLPTSPKSVRRACRPGRLEVQLRRELGHVRIRQLLVPGSEGRDGKPQRPVARGASSRAVGQPQARNSSEIYGKVSAVGERTYGAPADGRRRVVVPGRRPLARLAVRNVGGTARTSWTSASDDAVQPRPRPSALGRRRRGRQPRRLLDQRAQGIPVRPRSAASMPGAHKVEGFYLDKDELEREKPAPLWERIREHAWRDLDVRRHVHEILR